MHPFESVSPQTSATIPLRIDSIMPFVAVLSACSLFPCPSLLETSEQVPTAVPTEMPVTSIWNGKASASAASAFSPSASIETNTLSTILYNASTSIDIIMGSDIFIISDGIGAVAIRVSLSFIHTFPKNACLP